MTDRITQALATHRQLASHLSEACAVLGAAMAGEYLSHSSLTACEWIADEIAGLRLVARQADLAMEPVLSHLTRADQVARQRAALPPGAL